MDLSLTLSILLAMLAVYYFFKRKDPFEAHGLPCKTSIPLLGTTWPWLLGRKSFAQVAQDTYNLEPEARYVGFYNRTTPILVIRDPDLVKSVAVRNFDRFPNHRGFDNENTEAILKRNLLLLRDDRWKQVRALISPTFTSSKMRAMFPLISEIAVKVGDYLSTLPPEENFIEMKDIFTRYTNDVFASCAFGIEVNSLEDRENTFYTFGRRIMKFHSLALVKMIMLRMFPKLSRKLGVTVVSKEIVDFFEEVVSSSIRIREETGVARPDFIQVMMEARGKLGPGKELTIEDITAHAFAFFFGGFETTSSLACFAAYELATNPEVQRRLRDEIDRVCKETDEITYEKLYSMKYLDAVVDETLRMYPIIPITDRQCSKRFELPPAMPGMKPYFVNEGALLWIPIHAIHRDPKYFEKPDSFDPDRFLRKPTGGLDHLAYFPFGLGPRICIGSRFTLIEAKLVLFHILARCELKACDKTGVPMELKKTGVFLTSANDFWLQILPRNKVL
ncbi:PREDICTED: cytochrome P450 9e2-like [Habropoda laboriosa]|nr:PREDICTED: cytochrome P450 9e2-like [Habropoda laboriosa]